MAGIPEALARHVARYRAIVSPAKTRLLAAVSVLVLVDALLLARLGTVWARAGAAVLLLAPIVATVVVRVLEARTDRDVGAVLDEIVAPAAPREAERARRALALLARVGDGTSRELKELHAARSLAQIPGEELVARGKRAEKRLLVATIVAFAFAFGSCAKSPFAPIEGADVLFAREGRAPVELAWLVEPDVVSRPPDYLHGSEHHDELGEELELPRGTLVTVRAKPIHSGRRLMLTDGKVEVPFVDDGQGGVVARFPIADSIELRVVARFGDVVVEEPRRSKITSVPDLVPTVKLETAPRRVVLLKDEDAAEIPIRFHAEDDHGLREVHLVMRAGVKEERRVLSRLDGETKATSGGYVVRPASDAFVRASHVPIELRVAAKDNDPVTGPKWGESEAITIVPPEVGEPEALRLAALRAARAAYVDVLAYRLAQDQKGADEKGADPSALAALESKAAKALDAALDGKYAGLQVPSRTRVRVRLQQKKLSEAATKEKKAPSAATRKATTTTVSHLVLVVDAVVRGLAQKDARSVARDLSDSAEDLAGGALKAKNPADEREATARMDAAALVLQGGAPHLSSLGTLGLDLGEIASAGLLRIARARKEHDLLHAELAARDLALRLRTADPSFGARGGSKQGQGGDGQGGGEEGEGQGHGDGDGDVDQAFQEAASDLERLASDHAEGMGKVDQALAKGASDEDRKALAEEAKKHAEAIREAVKNMPSVGSGSDSWTSKGSAGKELAEQMARSLEEGAAHDAVSSGRGAMSALDEAKKVAQRSFGRNEAAEDKLAEAQRKLGPELKWAEDKLAQMKKAAQDRARGDLSKEGDAEGKIADRARDAAKKGQGAIPDEALDALSAAEHAAREAASALKQGDVERGQNAQRRAQDRLEAAKRALGQESSEGGEGRGRETGGRGTDGETPIPKADAHKGPEEFRKRVLRGLAQPGAGRQKDAVQRYAEGLLR